MEDKINNNLNPYKILEDTNDSMHHIYDTNYYADTNNMNDISCNICGGYISENDINQNKECTLCTDFNKFYENNYDDNDVIASGYNEENFKTIEKFCQSCGLSYNEELNNEFDITICKNNDHIDYITGGSGINKLPNTLSLEEYENINKIPYVYAKGLETFKVDKNHIHRSNKNSNCIICNELNVYTDNRSIDDITNYVKLNNEIYGGASSKRKKIENINKEKDKPIYISNLIKKEQLYNNQEMINNIVEHLESKNIRKPDLSTLLKILVEKGVPFTSETIDDICKSIFSELNMREPIEKNSLISIFRGSESQNYKQLEELEKLKSRNDNITFMYKYNILMKNYQGIDSINDLFLKYQTHDIHSVDPIIFSLFMQKHPAIEQTIIEGDSLALLTSMMMKRMLYNHNFMLTICRLSSNIEVIYKTKKLKGIEKELFISSFHTKLKKILYSSKLGNFTSKENTELDQMIENTYISSIKLPMEKDEHKLHILLGLFGARFVLMPLPVTDKIDGNCVQTYKLESTPYVYVDLERSIKFPESCMRISTDTITSFRYDIINDRVIMEPSYRNLLSDSMVGKHIDMMPIFVSPTSLNMGNSRPSGSPIIVNGTLIYFVNRTITRFSQGYQSDSINIYKYPIDTSSIDYEQCIVINGISYDLSSVVCYNTAIDQESSELGCYREIAIGSISLVISDEGWYVYNPSYYTSQELRKNKEERLFNIIKDELNNEDITNLKDMMNNSIFKQELFKLRSGLCRYKLDIYSNEEVQNKIARSGYIFIYSEDYTKYTLNKISNQSISLPLNNNYCKTNNLMFPINQGF